MFKKTIAPICILLLLVLLLLLCLFIRRPCHYRHHTAAHHLNLEEFGRAKGSWKNSARNISYDKDIIECELRSLKGEWVKNKFNFFDNYMYHNIDGKIEWTNCKNNVELNNISHEHIERRYKKISIERCLENKNSDYDHWFEIKDSYINSVKDKCISISLFKLDKIEKNKWEKKYYNSLINNLNEYNMYDTCVNLYLCNNLSMYIKDLSKYPYVNIFLMKSESKECQPGMLWRFMNITNKSYKSVYICDIDEKWNWINLYEKYDHKICTLKPSDGLITKIPYTPAYNFATIIGSHIKINPSKFNYNIVDVIKGFISLCKNRENSRNPYCFDDNDKITLWNQPVNDHHFGWGRITTSYAFDEFFLKHVMYYDAYPDFIFH